MKTVSVQFLLFFLFMLKYNDFDFQVQIYNAILSGRMDHFYIHLIKISILLRMIFIIWVSFLFSFIILSTCSFIILPAKNFFTFGFLYQPLDNSYWSFKHMVKHKILSYCDMLCSFACQWLLAYYCISYKDYFTSKEHLNLGAFYVSASKFIVGIIMVAS